MGEAVLLIDAPNLCMREAFAKTGLTYQGRPSGVIFGALQQVRSLLNRFPGEVAFCWDSERSLRREFWPGYKANRRGKEPYQAALDAYPQMALLREEILPRIGLPNQMLCDGFEADDLIGELCIGIEYQPPRPMSIQEAFVNPRIIVSSDNDLYQFLGPRTSNYNLGKKSLYTHVDFYKEYDCLPSQWPTVKAIAGDDGDGVTGVPGVGIKTAVKYMKGRATDKIANKICHYMNDGLVQRNFQLIRLPWPGCNPGPIRPSRLDEREFRKVCAEWGLGSLTG